MTTPLTRYTVQKVKVFRVFDERGQEVWQYDEYDLAYPLDFETEEAAWERVAREESLGFHGPLTQFETTLRNAYHRFLVENLTAQTPFQSFRDTRPLPMNGGKTIQFFT